ncbi:MAG: carboxypeptidase regulatory-like domain-containing protein [Terriglobia bacterium]
MALPPLAFAAAMFALAPVAVHAQTAVLSTISGIVTDPSGAVVPGVQITITNVGTKAASSSTTNASGFFTVPNLPSANYTVEASKTGFKKYAQEDLHLDPASSVSLRIALQVGAITQAVTVRAAIVHVQTSTAQVSRVISSTYMSQLPTNGRNFESLLALQPGVATGFTFNSFEGTSTFASQCTMVNGLSGESNNLLIDGAPSTRTRANGASVAQPSLNAVQEVNIVTNSYMPEYGRAAGGQIVVQMKSGTNHYHGDAFEYLRNDAFNARSFFSTTVPKLTYNDFGFDFGGQVIPKHQKLYFFWTEEWIRQTTGNAGLNTVPSMADRNGDFTNSCAVKESTCPVVPTYLNGVDGLVAGQPFPGDTVPQVLWSPNGAAMAHLFIEPNTPGTNLGEANNQFYDYNSHLTQRVDDIKGDYNVTPRNHLSVTLRHFDQTPPNPGASGSSSQLLTQTTELRQRGGSIDFTSTLSPTLLNDFNFGVNEDIVHVLVPGGGPAGNGLDRTTLGIDYPYILGAPSKDVADKIPTVDISGYPSISGLPYPSGSTGHVYDIQDVLTKISGNHTVKMGVWWEHDGENDHDQVRVTPGGGIGNNMNGQFTFDASNPKSTGSPYADTLLGNFDNYSELGWRNYTPWHAFQIGLFGQDSWKVTPRLTIQGGLRWDYFQPYRSAWCNFAMFSPQFYSFTQAVQINPANGQLIPGTGNPYNGVGLPCNQLPESAVGHFAIFGQPLTQANLASVNTTLRNDGMLKGLSPSIIASQFKDFQPRLGFAFDPTGSGKWAIRGGAGIFYNHNTLSDVTLMGGLPPFQLATEVFSGSADNPGGTPGALLTIPMTGQDLLNKTPVVYQWSFSVQHMLTNSTMLDVGYVADQARNLPINADLNQPALGTFNSPANAGINQAALRPYLGIGGAEATLQEGSSGYNSLQVSLQRHMASGLALGVSYTYSKTLDLGDSIYAVVTNTYDPGYNWGPAGFSRPNVLILTYVYTIPTPYKNSRLASETLGGWELAGDVALESGEPQSVGASGDVLGNGVSLVGGSEYAQLVPNCSYNGNKSFSEFFNTSCFFQPSAKTGTLGTLAGTAPKGLFLGPGYDNWDLSLLKSGNFTESGKVGYQFRADFFNVLNTASFTGISTGVTSSNFGFITGAGNPRNIQLGLDIKF